MIIFSITVLAIVAWFVMGSQQYKNFERYLKPGDPVRYYIGEEKYVGRVKAIGIRQITIETLTSKGRNIVRRIPIEDVYPVFYFNYKKNEY